MMVGMRSSAAELLIFWLLGPVEGRSYRQDRETLINALLFQ